MVWVADGRGDYYWQGPTPAGGLPPKPVANDVAGVQFGNYDKAAFVQKPGETLNPYEGDTNRNLHNYHLDAVDEANDRYRTKASQAGSKAPLPGETAEIYKIRMQSMGYDVDTDLIPDESAADWRERNAQNNATQYGYEYKTPAGAGNPNPHGARSTAYVEPGATDIDTRGDAALEQSDLDRNERQNEWAGIVDRYSSIGTDNAAGDEARGFQRETLDMQRDLINRMLDFDPDTFAKQQRQGALSSLLTAASGARGGYGAQQAAIQTAQGQAPRLFGEASRQASQLESERLNAAGQVAAGFGKTATDTRSLDEQRSQFEASLGKSIVDGIAGVTGQKWALDEASTAGLGQLAVEYARLKSAGLDREAQLLMANADQMTRRYGIDKGFAAKMAEIAANEPTTLETVLGVVKTAGPVAALATGKPPV